MLKIQDSRLNLMIHHQTSVASEESESSLESPSLSSYSLEEEDGSVGPVVTAPVLATLIRGVAGLPLPRRGPRVS